MKLAQYLFCNRNGSSYFDEETGRAGSWESMRRDFVQRVLAETKAKERFTDHDIRALCGSDTESLEHASQLLSHANSAITQRVYNEKGRLKAAFLYPWRREGDSNPR